MKITRVWILTAVAVVGAILIVGLLLRGGNRTQDIHLGVNSWVGYGPFYIAKERGFFAKRNLNVDLQQIEEASERRSALISGRLDGVGSTIDDLILSAAQGVPAKMVLGLDESDGADGILAPADISDIQQFKGKSIAVQPGFVNHFFLLYILNDNGLTSQDIILKPMDPEAANESFIAGDVDIAVTWEPHLSQVQDNRPDGQTFLTSTDYPGLIVDILVFRSEFIAEQPEAVGAFVDAWYEALNFIETNPDEAHDIIGRATGLEAAEVADILTGVKFLTPADNLQYHDPGQEVNVFSVSGAAGEIWQTEGYITQPVDPATLIETGFLEGSKNVKKGWSLW